ncbi:MAG: hypothetical protein AAGF46_00595 [Pseudomonadota bacterium]
MSGISVAEAPDRGQTIATAQAPVAAFFGRASAGPVNTPVCITHFTAFERLFGHAGDAPLALALQQFFDHGGQNAVVVRIANGATAGVIELPGAGAPLRLQIRNPGSGERLRASIDDDGLADRPDAFNLTLQRLGIDGTRIIDQELFPALSMAADEVRFVARALEDSALVRLAAGPLPSTRPKPMRPGMVDAAIGYVGMAETGSDGSLLSDYDLIGSDHAGTGLFALDAVPQVDFIWFASADCQVDPGPALVVAAEQYCQRRNAMLVLDPPRGCDSVAALIDARQRQPLAGPNSLLYYPPVYDRDGHAGRRVSAAGALIGLLCRADTRTEVWTSLADTGDLGSAALRRRWLPSEALVADDATHLLRLGVNPLVSNTTRQLLFPGLVTAANLSDKTRGSLTLQRLTKFILRQVDMGTRWALFVPPGNARDADVEAQVGEFLASLADAGAFRSAPDHPGWWVRAESVLDCDKPDGDDSLTDNHRAALRVLLGFHPQQLASPLMYLMTVRTDGTVVTRAAVGSGMAAK